jgi:RNA polymerase sigma-70 factor (ECF subfamily)
VAVSSLRSRWRQRAARLARLAGRARSGDRDAFRDLYQELYDPVLAFVRARVSVAADAEDLVALVFFKMLDKLDTYDPERGSVRTWVLAMARNAVIEHYRTKVAAAPAEALEQLADSTFGPLESLEGDERARTARAILARQSPEVREMFAMRFFDGLRYREIGELTGLSEAAVKQRFSRTLRELRAAFQQAANEEGKVDYAV